METAVPQQTYETLWIPTAKIYSDDVFNCRGPISPVNVAELAKGIQAKGLISPITIQPRKDVKSHMPSEFDWRIVAGHRRFKAIRVLGWPTIPSMVKEGLSEMEARLLNLRENVDREHLNILQEAVALKALYDIGMPRDRVARELNKSSGWVQVRFNLLSLPHEIQQEAAAGILNQYQIKQLTTLGTHDEMFDAVRRLKEAKVRGEKLDHIGKRKTQKLDVKKARKRDEIFKMIELVAKAVGYGLTTRFAAWVSGEISTEEFFVDLKREANAKGTDFVPPPEF